MVFVFVINFKVDIMFEVLVILVGLFGGLIMIKLLYIMFVCVMLNLLVMNCFFDGLE